VQRVSAFAKGISHGTSAFVAGESVSSAVEAGKDAARRRRQELAEELARRDDRLALRREEEPIARLDGVPPDGQAAAPSVPEPGDESLHP
jgi:hypothetical protein